MSQMPKCSECPMMKIRKRATPNSKNKKSRKPRGFCYCQHEDAVVASAMFTKNDDPAFIGFTKLGTDTPDKAACPIWCPKRLMEYPRQIDRKKAYAIIENRVPRGLFYVKEEERYAAIDNSDGEAWVEEFDSVNQCHKWLKGELT